MFDFYIDTYAITCSRECNVGDICLSLKIYLIVVYIKFSVCYLESKRLNFHTNV